jgi:hypothetical protein
MVEVRVDLTLEYWVAVGVVEMMPLRHQIMEGTVVVVVEEPVQFIT